jgi:hypothetical protein
VLRASNPSTSRSASAGSSISSAVRTIGPWTTARM